jgi:hypothetical protein
MSKRPEEMAIEKFAAELRKWWSFDDRQFHTHSWHAREDFIGQKLPELLAGFSASRVGWRPISEAPRDGTVIDLYDPDGGRWPNCYWGKPSHTCGEAGEYCDSDWHWLKPGWVDGTFDEHISTKVKRFTHWKPLDPPPLPGDGT